MRGGRTGSLNTWLIPVCGWSKWTWTPALQRSPHPGRCGLGLVEAAERPRDARHPLQGELRAPDGRVGHLPQQHGGAVRGKQQLVRGLGLLSDEDLRPLRRAAHERRPQQVAGGGTRPHHRCADCDARALPGRRARRLAAFPVAAGAGCHGESERPHGGRAEPRRVHGRAARSPGAARDLPAGRPHPGRAERPLGEGVQRRRHLQVARGAGEAVPGRGRRRVEARDRLLPHRGAFEPHLDGMGEPGAHTYRARGPSHPRSSGTDARCSASATFSAPRRSIRREARPDSLTAASDRRLRPASGSARRCRGESGASASASGSPRSG